MPTKRTAASRRASHSSNGRSGRPTARQERILGAMREEIERSIDGLRLPREPRPYFISHLLKVHHVVDVWGRYGAVFESRQEDRSRIYTEVRVGSRRLDNFIEGGLGNDWDDEAIEEWSYGPSQLQPEALRYALWRGTQSKYAEALRHYYEKRKIGVEERPHSTWPCFSRETPTRRFQKGRRHTFPREEWEKRVRTLSREFREHPDILDPWIQFEGRRTNRYFASSEGSEFVSEETYFDFVVRGTVQAEDGAELDLARRWAFRTPGEAPSDREVLSGLRTLFDDLRALREAEPLGPYDGPALLSGEAAGLFFHEAIGHRLEGERMLSRTEGQTFTRRLGEQILPESISIVDDPIRQRINGHTLFGSFQVDDQGVPAQRTPLIERGVLTNFLLSRATAPGCRLSNGHARNENGEPPMARMANLIVSCRGGQTWESLKAKLLEEVKRQGKPFGIVICKVRGGETSTSSYDFQAWKGEPTEIYRIDPETGEETRVRGVEFIGTPLVALQKILAVGRDREIDNAYCVAESGQIPVGTVSPPILVSEIELQQDGARSVRPPILPPPWTEKK